MRTTRQLPSAIYFDTNACREAGVLLDADWMLTLRSLAEDLELGMYLPQIVLDEWSFDLRERSRKSLTDLANSAATLSRLTGLEIDHPMPSAEEVTRAMDKVQRIRIANAGLTVTPTADVPLADLVERAVNKVPPFTQGDKGFRDTLILLSVGQHASTSYPNRLVFLVSNDKIFSTALESLIAPSVQIELHETRAIIPRMQSGLEEADLRFRDLEEEIARAFLKSHEEEIFEYAAGLTIPEFSIQYSLLADESLKNSTIKKIVGGKPTGIGFVLPKHAYTLSAAGTQIPIRFSVDVDLSLIVSQFNNALLFSGRTISLQEPTELPPAFMAKPEEPALVERSVTLKHSVYLKATATTTGDSKNPLGELVRLSTN